MTTAKRKSKKKVDRVVTKRGDGLQHWSKVGTLPKVSTFRFNKKRSPADSLVTRIKKLLPGIQSITEVGCSPKTNEYLRKELTKYAKKYTYYRGRTLESAVAFTMLDMSPCDLDGAEDFVLYVRLGEENTDELMGG